MTVNWELIRNTELSEEEGENAYKTEQRRNSIEEWKERTKKPNLLLRDGRKRKEEKKRQPTQSEYQVK